MKIVIKPIALYRDILGETLELYVDEPISVEKLIAILLEKYNLPRDIEPIIIINGNLVDGKQIIDKDSTIYLTPPFSGGGMYIDVKILNEQEEVDFNELIEKLSQIDPRSGAAVVFTGFVKGRVEEVDVYELEYTTIKETALKQMEKIAMEEGEKYGLRAVVIWHYTGKLKPSNVTIVIATLAPTRSGAFDAARIILERVKKEVPIFKLEKRSDGEYWIIGDHRRYSRQRYA